MMGAGEGEGERERDVKTDSADPGSPHVREDQR